jgi:hypothetical protein
VAAYGYSSMRWGCPSYAEADRPLTPSEVTAAFADGGLVLRQMPTAALRRGGSVYRYREANATLVVYVCSKHCALASDAFLVAFRIRPVRTSHRVSGCHDFGNRSTSREESGPDQGPPRCFRADAEWPRGTLFPRLEPSPRASFVMETSEGRRFFIPLLKTVTYFP